MFAYLSIQFCSLAKNLIMGNYSIDQFSSITGITKFVLRTWENRYAYLKANRSETNIRIYTDEMIVRALNTNYLLDNGYKISKVSKISEIELIKIISKIKINKIEIDEDYYINQMIISALDFDSARFNKIYDEGVLELGLIDFYKSVVLKTLSRIGILWLTNKVSPSQEHFLSEKIKQKLIISTELLAVNKEVKKTWLLFLPENEFHEIGLLFARFLLVSNGFNVIYLGSNLPYDSLNQVNIKLKIDNTLMFSISNVSKISIKSAIDFLDSNFKSSVNYIVTPEVGFINNPIESGINILSDVNSLVTIITK